MANKEIKFTLTQTEITGSIQNRLFVELIREKVIFEDNFVFYANLKIIRDKGIVRQKFTEEELGKITEALKYISENESTFPTKGSPEIIFEIENSFRLTIKYTNGWNFMLQVSGVVFRISYEELNQLNEILLKTAEILKVQK